MFSIVIANFVTLAHVVAQGVQEAYSFKNFASLFMETQIATPVDSKRLQEIDYKKCPQVDCKLYNWVIAHDAKESPMRCNIDGQVFKANEGLLDENNDVIYAIGHLEHKDYHIFIARVESPVEDKTFIDYYVFSKEGAYLSVLCLYEAEHLYYNGEYEGDSVYIASTLRSDRSICHEENRFNVNVKIDYQLQDDGILKEAAISTYGQYEVVDKDGYVNVREKPDVKSRVLYTIESGSIITSFAENGSKWEKVISIEGCDKKGGYVHSSRLRNFW